MNPFTIRYRREQDHDFPDYGWQTFNYADTLEDACGEVEICRNIHHNCEVCIIDNETNEIIMGEIL